MLRKILLVLSSLLLALILYLLFWPVNIEPKSWNAPVSKGYVDEFAPNHKLKNLKKLPMLGLTAPETIIAGPDNHLYASIESGELLRFTAEGRNPEIFFKVNGRVLGMAFDYDGNLIIADAFNGLFKLTPDKQLIPLATTFQDKPIVYANSLQVARDGKIYFTDSTTRHGAAKYGHTYTASFVDIFEHDSTGRVLVYDPATKEVSLVTKGFTFANGIALSEDERCLVFAETGSYRIHRYWLEGEKKGQTEVIIDNLPGFPDNVTHGKDNTFWVALIAPRNDFLDKASAKPFLRKIVWRLPSFLKPKAASYAHVVSFDGEGHILQSWQEPMPVNPKICGILETGTAYFFHSLDSTNLLYMEKTE